MRLVQVKGRLMTEPMVHADTQILHLELDHVLVNLELSEVNGSPLSQLRPGSLLRARGVGPVGCEWQPSAHEHPGASSFRR